MPCMTSFMLQFWTYGTATFIKLMDKAHGTRLQVPSCPHVTTTCCRIYSSLKEQLIETISSEDIAVTTDLWTSRAIQGYLTITAHFINSE